MRKQWDPFCAIFGGGGAIQPVLETCLGPLWTARRAVVKARRPVGPPQPVIV